jgi:hypothetical protein
MNTGSQSSSPVMSLASRRLLESAPEMAEGKFLNPTRGQVMSSGARLDGMGAAQHQQQKRVTNHCRLKTNLVT